MSFGNNDPENLRRVLQQMNAPSGRSPENAGEESEGFPWGIFFVVFVLVLALGVTIKWVQVSRPVMSTPDKHEIYIGSGYFLDRIRAKFEPELAKKLQEKYGFEISRILVHRSMERQLSPQLISLSRNCAAGVPRLPNNVPLEAQWVIHEPMVGYLLCMMREQRQRFCHESHRKLLVDQLDGYLELRGKVLAFQKVRNRFINANPMSRIAAKTYFETMQSTKSGGNRISFEEALARASIGEEVDGRIINTLRELIEEGYITSDDFSWMGVTVPAPFMPAFRQASMYGTPDCSEAEKWTAAANGS